MKKAQWQILGLIIFFVFNVQSLAQNKIPDYSALQKKLRVLLDFQSDIGEISNSASVYDKRTDYEFCHFLLDVAVETKNELSIVWELVFLEKIVACKADKVIIIERIQRKSADLLEHIDLKISHTNQQLASTNKQVIINMAIRLKDELRNIKELLR